MKKCEKCHTPLSSKVVFIAFWKGYINFECTNCSAKYKFKDRIIGGFVVGISTFISSFIMNTIKFGFLLKVGIAVAALAISAFILSALSTSLFSFERDEE
jgi:CXXC-20-CXXC protein